MIARIFAFTIIYGFVFATPAFCQMPDAEVAIEDVDLHAFVQLGNFSDRGIASILFPQQQIDPDVSAQANSGTEVAIPRDLLELLEVRVRNLAPESRELPGPLGAVKRWPLDLEPHTPKAAIDRFRKRGLIELFFHENTKLLDSPLTDRKELINRVATVSEHIYTAMGPLFGKVASDSELIIVAGQVRKLSVELDTEILRSLSPAERARISKLISHLLPSAIADAKQSNRKYALGSVIFDKGRPPVRAPQADKK